MRHRFPAPARSGRSSAALPLAVVGIVLVVALAGGRPAAAGEGGADEGAAAARRLTLERLYSLPSLIGTAPGGFAWSPDSRRLAFLWNDEGMPFRDVWLLDVAAPGLEPRRLTRLAPSSFEPEPGADAFAIARAVESFERDRGVTALTWRPDGCGLAFELDADLWSLDLGNLDRGSLDRSSLERGRSDPEAADRTAGPVRLTATEAAESGAAFGATGALAFRREGDLWLLETGGKERQLTSIGSPDIAVRSFHWSPDGSAIAFVEADRSGVPERSIPDYRPGEPESEPVLRRLRRSYPGEPAPRERLGILDAVSGDVRWLDLADPAPDMLLGFEFSPDGSRLAVDTSDFYAKERRIFVVDPATAEARLVARDADPENETFYFWRIAWAADSGRLYFLSDRDTDYHVWAVGPDGGEAEPLTYGSWAVSEMHPVEGGVVVVGNRDAAEERQLYFVHDDGPVPPVIPGGRSAGREPERPVRFSHRSGTHSPVLSPDGAWAAVHHSADDSPPDLLLTEVYPPRALHVAADEARSGPATARLREGEHRVTASPLAEFHAYRWVAPEYVGFPSHVDGAALHGRLTLPPDFDPERSYPAILGSVYTESVRNQWGGRTAHPTWGLDQFLAQQGYVLLNVDMRGSWGRGRKHRRGIRLDYGGMDIEDLASGVRFLETLGYVDIERVGIWGSSYGGLMAAMSLFRKPGLYAAGIAGAPATNVRHALTGQMAVMMRPEDQPAEYDDSSPVLHAEGLEDPLMIVHGMRDGIVLYKDSLELVQRLILLDKQDVELVTLPNAGHGWDDEGLAQTRFAFRRMVDFFDRHLKGCDASGEPAEPVVSAESAEPVEPGEPGEGGA